MTIVGCCFDGQGVFDPRAAATIAFGYELSPEEYNLLPTIAAWSAGVIAFWRFRFFNIRNKESSTCEQKKRHLDMVERANILRKWVVDLNLSA